MLLRTLSETLKRFIMPPAGADPDHLEEVILKDCPWGTTIDAPASWAASEARPNAPASCYAMLGSIHTLKVL